jgi:type II secretory pathway predicted ATPase ExeA
MYEQFFGLKDKPFSLTPNTRFVYSSTQFSEVEGQLLYGIGNHEGLMVVTGTPGTGKTTLCRALVERLLSERTPTALIVSPFVTGIEMLTALLTEFGVNVPDEGSYNDLLDRLTQFVLAKHALGKCCVVLFDEAQHLPPDALEQIRVLTNLETDDEKLIQVVLIGQPELLDTVRAPRSAQLEQRVSIRCSLGELDERETIRYVHHRLNVAGAAGEIQLSARAMKEVYRGSHGVPRLINLIADRALLAGYASHTRDIELQHVRKALAALRGEDTDAATKKPAANRWRRRFAAVVGIASVAVVAAGVSLWSRLGAATPEDLLYRRATMAYTASEAERDLRAFIVKYPHSARTRDGLMRLARLELSRGDRDAAIEHLSQLERLAPSGVEHSRAAVLTALTHLDAADTTAACSGLSPDLASAAAPDSMLARRLTAVSSLCAARNAPLAATAVLDSTPRPQSSAAHDAIANAPGKRDEVLGAKP